MESLKTPLVRHPPIILLAGLDAEAAKACSDAVTPLPTMRVEGPEAALQRLLVVRPMVVVVPGDSLSPELSLLRERVVDIAGVLIGLEGMVGGDELVRRLRGAVRLAERRRASELA